MTTVPRPDISKLQEDLGGKPDPVVTEPITNPFVGPTIKTPEGVPMNLDPPVTTGAPANEIVLDMPVLVISFGRGKCIVQDPIGTLVALEDAPSKMVDGSSATEIASLLRNALTSTTRIEFDKDRLGVDGAVVVGDVEDDAKQLTFTETRAVSDAIVKWSVELGKP